MSRLPKAAEIDITQIDQVEELIAQIEGSENVDRKKAAWRDYQIYAGNQEYYTRARLQEIYPDSWKKFRVGDVSLAKKITNKRAKAYKQQPQRILENDSETAKYQEMIDEFKFHNSWKEFDSIFNLHKYALMWLTYVNPTETTPGQYVMSALAPFEYDIVRDEITGEPTVFALSYPDNEITGSLKNDGVEQDIAEDQFDTSAETKKYSFWTAKNHVQVLRRRRTNMADGKRNFFVQFLSIEGNPNNENPIGRLPIAFLSREQAVDYPVPNNLGRQSVSWNVEYSDLRTASAAQGHGQLVISYPKGDKITKVHMGMHHALELPQSKKEGDPPTTATYISASPDLAGQLDILKFGAIQIMNDHGIEAKGGIEGGVEQFASGFDRLLSMADVHEIIQDNQTLYAETPEQQMYLAMKAYEESLNRGTFKSERVQVQYPKPKPMQTEKELVEEIKMKLEVGTIEEWEKFVILNPNLTEAEAKEKLKLVKAEKQAAVKEMADAMSESANESEEPEDEVDADPQEPLE